MRRESSIVAMALAAAFAGCTLAPSYTRPDAPVASTYPNTSEKAPRVAVADLGWKDVFGDERLQALLTLALENNRDLQVAALNVERFAALYRIERAALLPSVNATGAATFQELPSSIPGSQFAPKEQYSANLNATAWELDLFGRIRSLSRAALERFFATEEARRSVQLSLVAQVAIAHFNERALAEQLDLAEQTLATVQSSYELTRRAFERGVASELDLRTAESQVETSRFQLAFFHQRHAQANNALVFLVGTQLPGDLPGALPLVEAKVRTFLPPGLPSDLLQRRPDILAAEHELKAANASIGAARAAFFPSISLTGAAGFASTDLGQLFQNDGFTWNFTPRISLPIFQAGRLRASLDAAEVTKNIEVAQYERSIQNAFREVADALVAKQAIEDRLRAQAAVVAADERRYQLAERRYRAGIDSYVTLLAAQRDLYRAQQGLIDAQLERLANVADLYRALGGGWREGGDPEEG